MVEIRIPTWCLLIVLFACKCYSSASTPFLIWTNNVDLPKASSRASLGQSLSLKDVEEKYLNNYMHDSSKFTILFLQDKLSLDDLTKYSNKVSDGKSVFENLKKFLGAQSSVTLPAVTQEDKDSVVETLKKQHNGHFEEIYSSDIDVWKFNKDKVSVSKKNLFVFHLTPVKGSTEAGKISILSTNDAMIGKVINEFASAGIYTAILSAMQPSDIVDKIQNDAILNADHDYKRHLLSKNVTDKNLFNFDDCVYLYTTAIKFGFMNETVSFNGSSHKLSGSCKKNQSSISIVFGKTLPNKVTKFDLRMTFNQVPKFDWICSSVKVTYAGSLNGSTKGDMNIEFLNTASLLSAPQAMAYSCSKFQLKAKTTDNKTATLTFDRFQVQPFGIKNKRFSEAYDCATFFTIPILTGLFVTAVLLSVLFGGIIAMMSISTMDRFDDPKGPTIQVPHE